jgi:hypothetical protein
MPFYGAGGGEQALGRAERRAPDRRRVTGKGEQELAGGSVLHPRRIVAAGDGEQATIQPGLHARNTVIRLNSSLEDVDRSLSTSEQGDPRHYGPWMRTRFPVTSRQTARIPVH